MTGKSAERDRIDHIHEALDAFRYGGTKSFTVDNLTQRVPTLAGPTPDEVDRILLDMWRGGEEIHRGNAGDAVHRWSFGRRPFPRLERRLSRRP